MKRKQALVVFGLMAVAGLATGCEDKSVRDYLGKDGGQNALYDWEVRVQNAVCQLEDSATTTLDSKQRLCAAAPRTVTPPPSYPPKR
jgi:hypothetical protein